MMRRAMAGVVSVATLLLLGWLSRAPYTPATGEEALLRLSWRHRAERAEVCRPRTAEELEALPAHMRTPEVCEGRRQSYTLVVQVDGGAPDTLVIVPEGARQDRPIYVFLDRPVEPGVHTVDIAFTGQAGDSTALSFSGPVPVAAGEVALITTTSDGSALVRAGGR